MKNVNNQPTIVPNAKKESKESFNHRVNVKKDTMIMKVKLKIVLNALNIAKNGNFFLIYYILL